MKLMKTNSDQPIEMDMTPMIDVVFQLIIFFMLVTDMSQQDLAELKLPYAETSQKDEMMKGRLTFNILKDGEIEIQGDQRETVARVLREADPDMAFKGFVEGNDISQGSVDVVVTDGRADSEFLGLRLVDTGETLRLFDPQQGEFLRNFLDKGRFAGLLASLPLQIVLEPQVGLLGAEQFAARSL